ncbi:MAG: gamma-glutamyltransferase [Gemmatimonadales bacterium]
MNRRTARALLLVSLFGCSPAPSLGSARHEPRPDVESVSPTAGQTPQTFDPTVPAHFVPGWKFPAGGTPQTAEHGMVASSNKPAAEAGTEILKAGGNAVDAAVATGFALAVAYPEAGNIGGGGYMVIRLADGRVAALDYREMAPAAAFRDMYLDSTGRMTNASVQGRSAAGVPAAVAGLASALSKYGTMSLAQVMQPAIRMASEGIVVDSALARSVAGKATSLAAYAGAKIFLPGGKPIAYGSLFKQPELAETLRLVAEKGIDGFYKGRTADLIVAEMQRGCPGGIRARARASHNCGLITKADLAGYYPAWRTPVQTSYRGYHLITMAPSSSGGITLGETLNILEGFPSLPAFGSADYWHLVASAFQRAFIDRNELLGDPDFVSIPLARLTSKSYAAQLRATIGAGRATPTSSLPVPSHEGTETTQYSVVDAMGNAVSTTTTLNGLYGASVMVEGAGFFLNNTMDDFASQPGAANMFGLVQAEADAIAPRKRALSAMTPSIVLDPTGHLFMVLGARGGPRIITSTAQVILNVIDHHMTLADAMNAPRMHHQALPDVMTYDARGLDTAQIEKLVVMGYHLSPTAYVGGSVVAIRRVKGGWEGMDDPRGHGGRAVGY